MYILPNKIPINMDKLEAAYNDLNLNRKYYLDAETGDIIQNIQDRYKKGNRYFEVPKLPKSLKISWMREFAEEMVPYDSPELAQKLIKALEEENPAEKFMALLISDESGWIHGWSQWEADYIYEEIEEWFFSLPINIEDDMSELDDDCPLCRMMKEGINDMEILKRGFQEAKAKQMVDDIFRQAGNKSY